MGLDTNGLGLLLFAKGKGVNFEKSLMIGRQNYLVSPELVGKVLDRLNIADYRLEEIITKKFDFTEPFFEFLGASVIDSLDASTYEDASVIHDMNTPIPATLKGKYSMVFDGGSLEHVFNFPVGLKNAMEMVEEGGHFIGITPCNNFVGHGFYQFSPELFYRTLNERNGFAIERLIFYNSTEFADWYEVSDPQKVQNRVTLANSQPSLLFIQAKKLKTVPIFESFPIQSDYNNIIWEKNESLIWDRPGKQQNKAHQSKPSIFHSFFKKLTKRFLFPKETFNPIGKANPDYFIKINDW